MKKRCNVTVLQLTFVWMKSSHFAFAFMYHSFPLFWHQPYEHINFLFLKSTIFPYVRSLRLTDEEALNKPAGSTFIWSHFTKGNQMFDYSFRCLCTYSVQKLPYSFPYKSRYQYPHCLLQVHRQHGVHS